MSHVLGRQFVQTLYDDALSVIRSIHINNMLIQDVNKCDFHFVSHV